GMSFITEGPLKGLENRIVKYDWHRRFAQLEIPVSRRNVSVWAGIGIDEKLLNREVDGEKQEKGLFLVS
ncbi:transcription termination factor NusG, partial [[Clostridium] symbiosum]